MAGSGMGVDGRNSVDAAPSRSSWRDTRLPGWIPRVLTALAYAFAVLYFGLMATSAALDDDPMFRWRFIIGPLLSFSLVAALPPFRGEGLRARLHLVLMAAFIVIWVCYAGGLLSRVARPDEYSLYLGLAGPREEGLKILAVLFLAWTTTRAKGWPTRLILLGFAVGIAFSGIESAWPDKLPTLHPRGVFDRIVSNAKHGLYTAIAVSGFSIAAYLRTRWRFLVPLITFFAGAGAHAANNLFVRRVQSHLLFTVNDLPEVMTSEQYFNAPYYDALHYAVIGTFTLLLTLILAALIALTFRLARRSGWSPPFPPGSPAPAGR
jgi:PrsW family intramembrane metalloprotease